MRRVGFARALLILAIGGVTFTGCIGLKAQGFAPTASSLRPIIPQPDTLADIPAPPGRTPSIDPPESPLKAVDPPAPLAAPAPVSPPPPSPVTEAESAPGPSGRPPDMPDEVPAPELPVARDRATVAQAEPAAEDTASESEEDEGDDSQAVEEPAIIGPEEVHTIEQAEAPPEAKALPQPDSREYDVPIEVNDKVKALIHYLQARKKDLIDRAFQRAGKYLSLVERIFKEEGLPRDLINLAYIESAFNPLAVSRANAVGIWQFITSTARLFGLRVGFWQDERRDPEKATRAAAAYLKKLYAELGSWPLAIAAYNVGEAAVRRAIQRHNSTDFWSLRLPRETKAYVPAFMAMTIIAKNPERYGFAPPPLDPLTYDTVTLREPLDLRTAGRLAGVPVKTLRELNPELKHWATPLHAKSYTLKLPAGTGRDVLAKLESLPEKDRAISLARHRVRRGETLHRIGRLYHVDAQLLADLNGLERRARPKPGSTLMLPWREGERGTKTAAGTPRRQESGPKTYTVKRGDSLWKIARAFDVSPEDLRQWNALGAKERLRPGRRLKIHPKTEAPGPHQATPVPHAKPPVAYVVKRGDSLWKIARAFDVSPEDLRQWNALGAKERLRPGLELRIFTDKDS